LSAAIVHIAFYLYSIVFLSKRMKLSFQLKYLKEALKYSLPLLPNRVSSWGLENFNKVYLGKLLTNAAVGIYNVANYFGLIITVLSQSVSMAYQPFVYKLLDEGDTGKEKLKNIIIVLAMCYTIAGFVLVLFSKELLYIFIDKRYYSSATIIPIVVWGTTISAISTSYIYILFYYLKAPKHISISTIFAAIINVTGCVVLIPKFGLSGAVYSLFFSTIASASYKFHYANKYSKIKLNAMKIFLPSLLLMIATLIIFNSSATFATRVGIVTATVIFFLFVNKNEINSILKYLNK
ncbi:MAG: oligosaccharide flippase family protein, partial [Bacteroidales bacterium]|nr:oligosaccharide flippase family protein [Bacteroidales bacterium]